MEKGWTKKSSKELKKQREKWSFESKINALIEALKLSRRQQKVEHLRKILEESREGAEKLPSVTEAVTTSHEEEDLD
ncbi:MAG: hypothetical protein GU357_01610 [Thermofilum sp.]|jgi:hypothetical protein|nr:hypothetical protein [Thermofilum sp.]